MQLTLKITLYLIILLILNTSVLGQEPGMWHITDDDGLPSSTVYQITQDKEGYIWMGTEKGICRFDGRKFNYYYSSEFKDSEILALAIDGHNRLWFRNLSGQLFYIKNEVIYNTDFIFKDKKFSVQDLLLHKNQLYISLTKENRGYFARIDLTDSTELTPPFIYTNNYEHTSYISSMKDRVYAITRDYDKVPYQLVSLSTDSITTVDQKLPEFKNGYVNSIYIDNEQTLFFVRFGTYFSIYSLKNNQLTPFLNENQRLWIPEYFIHEDKLWLHSPKGIFIYPLHKSGRQNNNYEHILKDIESNCQLIDKEGNIWIGTTDKGIFVITASKISIYDDDNFNLPENEIYSLKYDSINKELIIGHSEGFLSKLSKHSKLSIIPLGVYGRTLDICYTHLKNTYLCANDRGLIKLNGPMKKSTITSFHSIKSVLPAKNGDIWIGSSYRIERIKKNDLNKFSINNPLFQPIIKERNYELMEDFEGNIWMSTVGGLYFYRQDRLHSYPTPKEYSLDNISTMVQSSDSTIWLGTKGNGLIAIKNNNILYHYTNKTGLASNIINHLAVQNNNLLIGTDNGLNKFDLNSGSWSLLNKSDGLPSNEINALEVTEKDIWVGTSKGLIQVPNDLSFINPYPPILHIDDVLIKEQHSKIQGSYNLEHDQDDLEIKFTALSFKGKGNVHYQYKLNGIDDNWISTTSDFVRYPSLAPGDYTFELVAMNEDGVKSKPIQINFHIHKAWWNTWWFRAILIVVFALLTWLFIQNRIQKQKREQFIINQIKDLQSKALRSQMNPHFIFNALNAIQKFLTTNDQEQAMIYLARFGKLIRIIFEQSQKDKISLEEELEFLGLYLDLEKLRFMDEVDIQLNIHPSLAEGSDEIQVPPLVIQPIIENSFKHGFMYQNKKGILKIDFFKKDDFIHCSVSDNGIGRKKAAGLGQKKLRDHTSSGLKTAKERVNLYNSSFKQVKKIDKPYFEIFDLYEEHGVVSGTKVEILIYNQNAEHPTLL